MSCSSVSLQDVFDGGREYLRIYFWERRILKTTCCPVTTAQDRNSEESRDPQLALRMAMK